MAVTKSIRIDKNAFLYLNDVSREQRGFGPLSEEAKEKMWKMSAHTADTKLIWDGYLGGGIGSQDYKTWTEWDLETIKKILDTANLKWTDGPDITYIDI